MARRSRTIHEAVEAQSTRCRTAAMSLDAAMEHENSPDPVLVECARLFQSVAEELTRALADRDVSRVKQLFELSVGLATVVAPFVAVGIAIDQPTHQCVVEIQQGAEADGQIIEDAEEVPAVQGSGTASISINATARGEAPDVDQLSASLRGTSDATARGTVARGVAHERTATDEVGGRDSGPEVNVVDRSDIDENWAAPFGQTSVSGERPGRSGEASGTNLEETINDIVGIDDSVVKGLAETAASSFDLPGTAKDLAETVGGVVDPADVRVLAETAAASAGASDATVSLATAGAKGTVTRGVDHDVTISDTIGATDEVVAQAEIASVTAHDATVDTRPPTQVVEIGTVYETDTALPINLSQIDPDE